MLCPFTEDPRTYYFMHDLQFHACYLFIKDPMHCNSTHGTLHEGPRTYNSMHALVLTFCCNLKQGCVINKFIKCAAKCLHIISPSME